MLSHKKRFRSEHFNVLRAFQNVCQQLGREYRVFDVGKQMCNTTVSNCWGCDGMPAMCTDLNADPGTALHLDVVGRVENVGEHVPGRLCRGTWDGVTTSWGDVVGKSNG